MAPSLAICGLLFYHLRPYLVKPVFYPLVLGMFTMGLYSFVFIGLRFIAKTSSLYF